MSDTRIKYDNKQLKYTEVGESYTKIYDLGVKLSSINPDEYSLRFQFNTDTTTGQPFNPLMYNWPAGTWKHISGRIWQWTYNNPVWSLSGGSPIFGGENSPFNNSSTVRLISGNTQFVTNMDRLFYKLSTFGWTVNPNYGYNTLQTSRVTSMVETFYATPWCLDCPIKNFSAVTTMQGFFDLSSVPLRNPANIGDTRPPGFHGFVGLNSFVPPPTSANVSNAFRGCNNIGGAESYYMYLTMINPGSHSGNTSGCFKDTAKNEVDPASMALYNQIPSSWK